MCAVSVASGCYAAGGRATTPRMLGASLMLLLAMVLSFALGMYSTHITHERAVYRFIDTPLSEQKPQVELERIFQDTSGHDTLIPAPSF